MFAKAEVEALRLRRQLLVLKSDADRLLLASELRRIGSAEFWLVKAGNAATRHPVLTAALGGGVGLLVMRTLTRPGSAARWLGRLGTLTSVALSLWKLVGAGKRGA